MKPTAFDRFYYDGNNWKLGLIYFCRADQRILVPKRIRGLGWTLNFARPLAIPSLGFFIALAFGLFELVRSFGAGRDLQFAVQLLLSLGVIAACYKLLKSKADVPKADVPAGKK